MADWHVGFSASSLGQEEVAAVAAVVATGRIGQGPLVARFESDFAASVSARCAVATASGSSALLLALTVAGVSAGDDVVMPSLCSIATADAVRHIGATPVFADVDATTGNVTGATIGRALTATTTAVVAVDRAGVPVDLHDIREVTDPLGIVAVEDATDAAGSTYRGRPVGAGAEIVAWSFGPDAVLTTGEGGMVTTPHGAWAARATRLRDQALIAPGPGAALPPEMECREVGWDVRMTDLQAAVGLVQLRRLPAIVDRRRRTAERYRAGIEDVPGLRAVADPAWGTGNAESFWVVVDELHPLSRDAVLAALTDAGVSARRNGLPVHHHASYRALTPPDGLPVTDSLTRAMLILPLHHALGSFELDRVVAVLREPRSSVTISGTGDVTA